MSGGVDSAVAAARLVDEGHEVVGATMKLWGGSGDSGCCSVADVTDTRRVADRLGVDHRVFNFTDEFDASVVGPYVEDHRLGRTPNPCVACNNELKFGRFLERALRLGFDAIATGHHARVAHHPDHPTQLLRGADRAKDQSYVLSGLDQHAARSLLLPVGELTKSEVRRLAAERGLGVATKPDSQDVCFIASRTRGRSPLLPRRTDRPPSRSRRRRIGRRLGEVEAIELVTIGQRRGLGAESGPERRYVVDIDVPARTVTVGPPEHLLSEHVALSDRTWTADALADGSAVEVQISTMVIRSQDI